MFTLTDSSGTGWALGAACRWLGNTLWLGLLFVGFLAPIALQAQCPNDNVFEASITSIPCGGSAGTRLVGGGTVIRFNVEQGANYTFNTCGSTFNTQLALYYFSGAPNPGAGALTFNDDACGVQSSINWTANFTGVANLVIDQFNCTWSSTSAILSYQQNPPAAPPAIGTTASPACGSVTLNALGAAPTGQVYHWVGTNPNSTTSLGNAGTTNFTASASGTYYARAQHTTTGCWGPATGVTVTVVDVPGTPNPIVASTTTICQGQTGVTFTVDPLPNATSYEWILPTGLSITAGNGTNAITVTASAGAPPGAGTVFVRGRNDLPPTCDGPTRSLGITVAARPANAGPITPGSTNICQGTNGVTFSIAAVTGAASYDWTVPPGATINGPATGTSITVDFGAGAATGTQAVTVTPRAGTCTSNPATVNVTVHARPAQPGVITPSSANACQGQNGITYSIAPVPNATEYQWTVPPGATIQGASNSTTITVNYSTTAPTGGQTVSVVPVNTAATSCAGPVRTLVVTVNPKPADAGVITATPANVCQGQIGVTYTVPLATGADVYDWVVPTGASIVSGAGSNTITVNYALNAPIGATQVRVTPRFAATGCVGAQATANVTVNAKPDITVVSTSNTVCAGSSVFLIANGASTYTWSPATGLSSTSGQVVTATPTTNITYTVIGQNSGSGCADTATVSLTVVTPPSTGGVSPDTAVCNSGNSGTLRLNGAPGSVLRWESSTDGGLTWTAISNTTTTLNFSNLTQTTRFRAISSGSGCPEVASTPAIVTVDQPAVGGTVFGNLTLCTNNNTGFLALNGHQGGIVRWETSTNGGTNWTPVTNTTTAFSYSNLTLTTQVRAVVRRGSCPEVFSTVATLTIDSTTIGGTTAGADTVCSGVNGGTITLSGQRGTILRWESSTNGGLTWAPIANVTNTQAYTNLLVTTRYRAVIQSGVCPALPSAHTEITVDSTTLVGTLTGGTSVCNGQASGTLTLNNSRRTIIRWESSTDGGASWTPIANTLPVLTYLNLTQTTRYRVVVASGVCPQATSNEEVVNIFPLPTIAATAADDTICQGESTVLTATGGVTYSWSPTTYLSAGTGTSVTLTAPAGIHTLTVTGVDANGCQNTGTVQVLVQPLPTVSVQSVQNVLCNGGATGIVTLSASGGSGLEYSRDGGVTRQPFATFGNLPAGNYTFTVYNAEGCSTTVGPITVNEPPALAATDTSFNVRPCAGAANGRIELTVSGGTVPYRVSYDSLRTFTAPVVGANFSRAGLAPGTYHVFVLDNNNCLLNVGTHVITQPTPLAGTFTQTNVTGCNGNTNGSLTVTPTGGTAPYEVSIDNGTTFTAPGAGPFTFPGLGAGNYPIVVRDDSGCVLNLGTAVITQPVALSAAATAVNVSGCFGNANGIIAVLNAQGGSGTYEFTIDGGGTWSPIGLFSSLAASTYNVQLRDAANPTCVLVVNSSLTLTQPAVLSGTATGTDVTGCHGNTNGSIDITAPAGGSGAYEYTINGGSTWQASGSFTGLAAGTYDVRIRDAANTTCVIVLNNSLTLNQPARLNATAVSTNLTSCAASPDGQITLTNVTGGSGAYEYSIDSGLTWQTTPAPYTALAVGTYDVLLRDQANPTCVVLVRLDVPLFAGTPLSASLVQNNAGPCNGDANGSITVTTPAGGSGRYEYTIDGGTTWQTAPSFTGLAAGVYDVRIRDSVHSVCVLTLNPTLNLREPAPLAATVGVTDLTSCLAVADGQIALNNPTGGSGTYEYSIDSGLTWQAGGTPYTNLGAGSYDVLLRDAAAPACVAIVQLDVVLTAGVPITALLQVTQPGPCAGAQNGVINVIQAQGGSGTFEYSYDGGLNWMAAGTLGALDTGSYQVRMRDATNPACELDLGTVVLTTPAPVSVQANVQGSNCTGASSSSLAVFASGGTPPFTYSRDSGATYGLANQFNGVTAGTYTVIARDANGCADTATVSVTFPAVIQLSYQSHVPPTCAGATDGSMTFTATGGVRPYRYVWGGSPSATDSFATGLSSGMQIVTVIDANNCFDTAMVYLPAAAPVQAGADVVSCFTPGQAFAPLTLSGGTPAGGLWAGVGVIDPAAGVFDPTVAGGVGRYTLFYTVSGCTDSLQVVILRQAAARDTVVCIENTLFQPIFNPGYPGQYASDVLPINPLTGLTVLTQTGRFAVRYQYAGSCEDTLWVTALAGPTPNFTSNPVLPGTGVPVQLTLPNAQVAFTDQSTTPTGSGPLTYEWDFGDGSLSRLQNPAYLYTQPGTYSIRLRVTNALGCSRDTLLVNAITVVGNPQDSAPIPNVFTPNGDGINDEFVIPWSGLGLTNVQVVIFDRQGRQMFSTTSITESWRGTLNNADAPEGQYYYVVKGFDANRREFKYSGSVTLLR